jgi:iron(III) transport system ATP-binding protein
VLLFDEPLSNLDAKLRRRVREEIRELQQDLNLTVAYVTHDQEEALAVSDKIIVMSNAKIAQQGAPRELYEEPANAFVADFIGDANLIDVTVTAVAEGRASVAIGPASVSLPARGLPAGPARVAIRPESLLLTGQAGPGSLPGTVRKCAYLGNHLDLMVETQVGELFVVQYGHHPMLATGTPVNLTLAGSGVTLIPPN